MAINIGGSSINSIYVGDTKVKSVYLGDKLVYSSGPVIEIDDSYNTFIFDTSKVSGSTTVTLQNNRAGDTTEWDGITDWGDGTADTKLTHKYKTDGVYTVNTKYTVNKSDMLGDVDTRNMFIKCININRNITNCSYLFSSCNNLIYINTIDFDTSNVTNMNSMFHGSNSLTSLDLSGWNTSKVTSMNYTFCACNALSTLNLSGLDVSNVTNMAYMFYNCTSLALLNISGWNMDNVTSYRYMLRGCSSLTIDNIIMTNCNDATKTKIQEALVA